MYRSGQGTLQFFITLAVGAWIGLLMALPVCLYYRHVSLQHQQHEDQLRLQLRQEHQKRLKLSGPGIIHVEKHQRVTDPGIPVDIKCRAADGFANGATSIYVEVKCVELK